MPLEALLVPFSDIHSAFNGTGGDTGCNFILFSDIHRQFKQGVVRKF